jgi:hypothetical protein
MIKVPQLSMYENRLSNSIKFFKCGEIRVIQMVNLTKVYYFQHACKNHSETPLYNRYMLKKREREFIIYILLWKIFLILYFFVQ